MAMGLTAKQELIMHFTCAPSAEDLLRLAEQVMDILPDELIEKIEELDFKIEDFPDEALMQEQELETEYDLVALYKFGQEIAPGVIKKKADGQDVLLLFRRPILDLWCETQDDLLQLMREIMIEEIATAHEFLEADIQTMIKSGNF